MARRRRGSGWLSLWQTSLSSLTRTALRSGQKAASQTLKATLDATTPKRKRRRTTAPALVLAAPPPRVLPGPRPRAAKRAAPAPRPVAPAELVARQVLGPAGRRDLWLARPVATTVAAGAVAGVATGIGTGPGPGTVRRPRWPLLLMLHGCDQTALSFAASTRMHRIATRAGCCVLYAQQDRHAHPHGCWRWYATRNGSAQAEAATLMAAIDQLVRSGTVDPTRIAVAGLSAGAGMAALLASLHPRRFAAVVMHSGVAPGAAHSPASALSAMLGRRAPWLAPVDEAAAASPSARAAPGRSAAAGRLAIAPDRHDPWPPLLVIQGLADRVVAASNGEAAAQAWAARAGAVAGPTRLLQRGERRLLRLTDFRRGRRLRAQLCEIEGLGHAWSGGAASQPYGDPQGPDASRLVWRFVARAFGAMAGSDREADAAEDLLAFADGETGDSSA